MGTSGDVGLIIDGVVGSNGPDRPSGVVRGEAGGVELGVGCSELLSTGSFAGNKDLVTVRKALTAFLRSGL